MKILILSAEVWQNENNGGNVLSNLFSNFNAEFAQIYCNPGFPTNNICHKYFQITDKSLLTNLFKPEKIGNSFNLEQSYNSTDHKSNSIFPFFNYLKTLRFDVFYTLRELVWSLSKWKNTRIKKFILDFNPDVIFAPCYGSLYMLDLTRFVSKITNKKIISYISDDHYSIKTMNFSFFGLINKLLLRSNLRRTFKHYDLMYTMTDEQKQIYSKFLKCPIKILKKGVDLKALNEKKTINNPIKLIYAGGLYLERWKTLVLLVNAIQKINTTFNKSLFHLTVYSNSKVNKKVKSLLNDKINSTYRDFIPYNELMNEYPKFDISLHVESFKKSQLNKTKLSFSTKIVECLSSSTAVMVISPSLLSSYKYLNKLKAAICISEPNDIYNNLLLISNNNDIIFEYSKKAYEVCKNFFNTELNSQMLGSDFIFYSQLS